MKNVLWRFKFSPLSKTFVGLAAAIGLACGLAGSANAAPFDRQIAFTQPDGTTIQLHGKGDEFSAVFETLDGYTVVFDPSLKAYCFAKQAGEGSLVSTGTQVHRGNPVSLGVAKGVRMSADKRRQMVVERWQRWERAMQTQSRWNQQKALARQFNVKGGQKGPQDAPPPFTTTGLKVGLTLLVDFSDDPATVPQADVIQYCNSDNYTGFGNNGSVKKYFSDVSNGQLTYTNVVTIYIRVPQVKSFYNDTTKDAGDQANILIKDALDTLKALPDYATTILPTFSALTVDGANQVLACNVFYAGGNGGVWSFGLWPHSWALFNAGAQPLGNGMSVFRYQITNIGGQLELGTFCHENGHMLCGYPDLYDYDYDSVGGAGEFCLMGYGGDGGNPAQVCAYLKRASGWATTTELDAASAIIATAISAPAPGFNHFYRFQKPGVPTEYYLVENRQKSGRDAGLPGSGVAIWHVDELGDRDNQSTGYNSSHANFELSLVQADGRFDLQQNVNYGEADDLFHANNGSAGYLNEFADLGVPSSKWWDGSLSGLRFGGFSGSGETMTFDVGFGLPILKIASTNISGGNGNGIIDNNECNNLFFTLTNGTPLDADNVQVRISTVTPGVGLGVSFVSYGNLPAGTEAVNPMPFTISTAPNFLCGLPITLEVLIKSDQTTRTNTVVLNTGTVGPSVRFDNFSPAQIPDNNSEGTNSFMTVSNITAALNEVEVSLHLTHTWIGDVRLRLVAPDGTGVMLSLFNGSNGDNYGSACSPETSRTTFDDDAATPVALGFAPYVGRFRPDEPLSAFIGKSGSAVNGQWRLRLVDNASFDIGTLQCWSLILYPGKCVDGGGTCPGVDLGISMVGNPEPVYIGSNLVYTLIVTNAGPSAATNTVVNQILPSSVVFVSATTSQGSVSHSSGSVVANLGSLPLAGIATVNVVVTPVAAATITSTATVTSNDEDLNPSNNTAAFVSHINPPAAELALSLADAPDPAVVGGPLTYSIVVTNHGPSAASLVTVSNTLPLSYNVFSVVPSQGTYTVFGNVVVCNFGGVPVGGHVTAQINGTPAAQGTLVATATARAIQNDPIPANNTATTTTTVGPSADLAVTLASIPSAVVLGNNWTYRVTVTNLGPNSANSAVMNATLPAGVNVVSTNTTQGALSRSNNTVTCALGTLAPGNGAVINIVVNTATTNLYNATANVSAAPADLNPANNNAGASTLVSLPNVQFVTAGARLTAESFSPPNGTINVGESVTVRLRLRNAGNVNNTNLVATLLATGGVTSPSGAQTYGVLAGGGAPVEMPFTFIANGTNGGTVVATLQLQDGPNNLGTLAYNFALPNVRTFANTNAITIRDNNSALPYPSVLSVTGVTGLVGRVTVTLSNFTHTFPRDVNVLLVGPTGTKSLLMSHATDQGFSPASPAFTLVFDEYAPAPLPPTGLLAAGAWRPAAYEPAPLFLTNAPPATNPPAGPYVADLSPFANQNPNGEWRLFIMDDAGGDAGAIAAGWNLAIHTISPVNQLADIAIVASVTPNPGLVGSGVTYTFVITNSGPNIASAIAFTNVLPPGAILDSASSSQGTPNTGGNTVTHNILSLAPGAFATVTVVATPTAAGQLINTASVTGADNDLNPGNNIVSVISTNALPSADLSIAMTGPTNAVDADPVPFTITVVNNGPQTALNVLVTNQMPPGLVFSSATTSQGVVTNISNTLVIASLGNLNAGASATVEIVSGTFTPGSRTNHATVATTSSDANSANNSATAVVVVSPREPKIVPVSVALTAESIVPANAMLDFGETVTVSLGLQNIGHLGAANVTGVLLPVGGVSSPSGPQHYGALYDGGPAVSRPFSFTAPATGSAVTVTLQLTNAGVYAGEVEFLLPLPATGSFSNSATIVIPENGPATPYPSTIQVTGLTGVVTQVTVSLNGLTHAFPDDVDVLLVAPSGEKAIVMSDAGGGHGLTNVTLTFEAAALTPLPDADQIVSGTAQPSDYESGDTFIFPAPVGTAGGSFSALDNAKPNGTWSLYVMDDATGDAGSISNGWSLTLTTKVMLNPVCDLAISLSDAPDPTFVGNTIVYTMGVTNFGPSPATDVTVTDILPPGLNYGSASASQGSVSAFGNFVIVSLGNLAPGASALVTLRASPSTAGNFINVVTVTANESDFATGNNGAQTSTLANVAAAPEIHDVSVSGGQLQGMLTAQPHETYNIQASTNLTGWITVDTLTLPIGGTGPFTDSQSPGFKSRFYRAVRLTP